MYLISVNEATVDSLYASLCQLIRRFIVRGMAVGRLDCFGMLLPFYTILYNTHRADKGGGGGGSGGGGGKWGGGDDTKRGTFVILFVSAHLKVERFVVEIDAPPIHSALDAVIP